MSRGRWIAVAIVALAAAAALLVLATAGPPAPVHAPPGALVFAALGDAPYYFWEDLQYRVVLEDLAAHELAFVIHVGDVFWRPCTDAHYRRSREVLDGVPHPVIYTPGDNEWTDCWEPGSGSFSPLERLERIRALFFEDPASSLGGRPIPLASQAAGSAFPELRENARWTHAGVVFATVHLVGSRNAGRDFPGRTSADDAAVERRTAAATAWLDETFDEAEVAGAAAVVLAFHANPAFEEPAISPERQAFEPFLGRLAERVERFAGPVLAVHGDDHVYTVDHPLAAGADGRTLQRFTRLQVPGSPDVGWVRVVVDPGGDPPFRFEPRVVPRWKYW